MLVEVMFKEAVDEREFWVVECKLEEMVGA